MISLSRVVSYLDGRPISRYMKFHFTMALAYSLINSIQCTPKPTSTRSAPIITILQYDVIQMKLNEEMHTMYTACEWFSFEVFCILMLTHLVSCFHLAPRQKQRTRWVSAFLHSSAFCLSSIFRMYTAPECPITDDSVTTASYRQVSWRGCQF